MFYCKTLLMNHFTNFHQTLMKIRKMVHEECYTVICFCEDVPQIEFVAHLHGKQLTSQTD